MGMTERHQVARRARRLSALLVAVVIVAPVAGSAKRLPPDGFRITKVKRPAAGVVHYTMRGQGHRINVARISSSADVEPTIAVARNAVGPDAGRQTTSRMCSRHDCIVGVNGDFYYDYGRTAGAIVIDGEPWLTRRAKRPQFTVDDRGRFGIEKVNIPAHFMVKYIHALEPIDERFGTELGEDNRLRWDIDGINTPREKHQIHLYTHRHGETTATSKKGVDLIGHFTNGRARIELGATPGFRLTRLRESGNATIPTDGFVLSGYGDAADVLRTLWKDAEAGRTRPKMRLRIGGPEDLDLAIGGRPELLRGGKLVEQADDWFSRAPYARTAVGWDDKGRLYLVTVDRTENSTGMSLTKLAKFLKKLGVRNALNLDGGGSTTFVRDGTMRNRAGYERRVANALLIVRS